MTNANKAPSLLEGLDIPDKSKKGAKASSSGTRKDVASAAASSTVSRDWTPTQKKIAAIGLACGALAALALGGVAFVRMRPLELPKTYEEGKLAMETSKFQNMDEVRKAQYRTEMDRLTREKMGSMKEEDRRAFFRDDSNREVMMQIREQQFDEMARKMARGEKIEFPRFGPGGPGQGGPGGFGPGGPGGPRTGPVDVASLANFQPRPGDDPPSPAPRTNENRREWGNNGNPNGNQPGNTPGVPNNGAPGGPNNGPPGSNNAPGGQNNPGAPNNSGQPASAPGAPANSGAPAASGGGSGNAGGGSGGGGGPGRRGNPTARIANRIQKGNAQSNGLRFEMGKKMMANAPRQENGQNPGIRILFTSGSAELNELAYTTMAPLVKQLTEQPENSLRIWGLIDQRTDGMKLRSTALRNSFAVKLFGTGAKGEQLTKDQLEQQMIVAYNELLATKAAAENKPAPALVGPNSEIAAPAVAVMEQALTADAANPTDLLVQLAQQRQDAIKKYLVEKHALNPVRVRTIGVAPQFMETQQPSAVLQVGR